MKRIGMFGILFMVLFLLTSCEKELNDSDVLWNSINEVEFTGDNNWAGVGLYFYEEEGQKYCVHMTYGSGLPVAGFFIAEIEIMEDGSTSMLENVVLLDQDGNEVYDYGDFEFEITDEGIIFGDLLYEDKGYSMHEFVIDNEEFWTE